MNELVLLRPYWLLALIPAGYLLWKLWSKQAQKSGWKSVIAPEFQPYLLNKNQTTAASPFGLIGLGLIWLAAIIALSGPSWHQQPIPTQKTQTGTVVVLDLSLSMFADDIEPNRLTRVQFKLNDLLQTYPEIRIGMVGYSGTAHIISPIADDNRTLQNLLPHLNPLIMPSYGSDAVSAFKLAIEMINGAQVNQGHIIWITDDIETDQIEPIQTLLALNNLSLSLLAVGTETGGAINIPDYGLLKNEQDELVQAAVPLKRLANLAAQSGAKFQRLQLDNSDLADLTPNYLAEQTQQQDEKPLTQALDYGVYLLGMILFLSAFALRRGWLASLAWLTLIPGLVISPPSFAENEAKPEIQLSDRWRQIYLTGDQRGYQAWQQKDYIGAEREFDNPAWRGAALYRQGLYQQAAEAFKQDPSAEGHYNRGNALAQLGDLDAAKTAYQQALELKPDFQQAQKNLELVEQQLKQAPKSESDNPQNQEQPETSPQSNSGEQQGQNPEQSEQQQDAQSDSQADQTDNEATESQNQQQNSTGQTESSPEPNATESDQKPSGLAEEENLEQDSERQQAEQQQREQNQADQTWLNQIQDRPGLFLRRKFDYQYQQNPPANPQQNKRKLW